MLRLIIAFVFSIIFSSSIVAQSFPEYEGVYLRTKDGRLHALPRATTTLKVAFGIPDRGGIISDYPAAKPVYLHDIWQREGALPVFNANEFKSIVVNSRKERPLRISGVAFSEDYFPFPMQPLRMENASDASLARNGLQKPNYKRIFINSNWGWEFSSFRTKNIDEFNTEFDVDVVRSSFKVAAFKQAEEVVTTVAWAITLSDGYDYIFLTPEQAEDLVAIETQTFLHGDDEYKKYLTAEAAEHQ